MGVVVAAGRETAQHTAGTPRARAMAVGFATTLSVSSEGNSLPHLFPSGQTHTDFPHRSSLTFQHSTLAGYSKLTPLHLLICLFVC